jgi:hypothetical protein
MMGIKADMIASVLGVTKWCEASFKAGLKATLPPGAHALTADINLHMPTSYGATIQHSFAKSQ